MKRKVSFLLIFALLCTLVATGCSSSTPEQATQQPTAEEGEPVTISYLSRWANPSDPRSAYYLEKLDEFRSMYPYITVEDISIGDDSEAHRAKVNSGIASGSPPDMFITNNNMTPGAMPVHTIGKEPYYIGVFLVGAYQEILGDLHNLFGDTNAVHISVYKDRYEIDQVIDGETVAEVLDYVQFSPKKLVRSVEAWVTTSMKAGIITPEEGREFLSNYRSGLYGYTYLETD